MQESESDGGVCGVRCGVVLMWLETMYVCQSLIIVKMVVLPCPLSRTTCSSEDDATQEVGGGGGVSGWDSIQCVNNVLPGPGLCCSPPPPPGDDTRKEQLN